MARGRTDAIIAGVNKAGTTSLFVSLSTHPDVAPSSIKETRYFLPARYGQSLPPVPHSNAVPQRLQARRRSGRLCSVGSGIIIALLGVIAREINHPVVTALRQA